MMADQLLDNVRDIFEGQIDFEGQRLAEILSTVLLSIAGVIAFVVGYVLGDVHMSLWVGLGCTVLTFLIVVPPWPFFNKNPVQWLPIGAVMAGAGVEVDGKKIN